MHISKSCTKYGGEIGYGLTWQSSKSVPNSGCDMSECGKLQEFATNSVDKLVTIILSCLSAKICYGSEHDISQKGALLTHKSKLTLGLSWASPLTLLCILPACLPVWFLPVFDFAFRFGTLTGLFILGLDFFLLLICSGLLLFVCFCFSHVPWKSGFFLLLIQLKPCSASNK